MQKSRTGRNALLQSKTVQTGKTCVWCLRGTKCGPYKTVCEVQKYWEGKLGFKEGEDFETCYDVHKWNTELEKAIKDGNSERAEEIINKGVDVNAKRPDTHHTYLHLAVRPGHYF